MAFIGKQEARARVRDAEAQIADKRQLILDRFDDEPFLGYDSLMDSINDCTLSSQTEVLARLLNRENLFISGPAGSGKTTIIKKFIDILDAQFEGNFSVAITASTGLAAKLIDGRTVHSWSGLGVYDGIFNPRKKDDPNFPKGFWRAKNHIKYTDVLIIDEISMLSAYYLDNINTVCQFFRRNKKPFGGIQVVFLGDFLQLPPVPPKFPKEDINYGYAITSDAWKNANVNYCYMDKTHRASDKYLKYLLRSIETDQVNNNSRRIIDVCRNHKKDEEKNYTTLFTTNNDVDKYNQKMLDANPNRLKTFKLIKEFGSAKNLEKLISQRGIAEGISLKKDAVVIITANVHDPDGDMVVANGSVGKIVSFDENYISVKLNSGETELIGRQRYELTEKREMVNSKGEIAYMDDAIAQIQQFPIKLGYAITVHKSQGQTFDGVEVDLSKCFTPGLGYVALSRIRDAKNLIVKDFNDKAFDIDERSMKISKIVKKKAKESREDFVNRIDTYEPLLDNRLSLMLVWDVENSAGYRQQKDSA